MNFKEELEKKTGEVETILAEYLPKQEDFKVKCWKPWGMLCRQAVRDCVRC